MLILALIHGQVSRRDLDQSSIIKGFRKLPAFVFSSSDGVEHSGIPSSSGLVNTDSNRENPKYQLKRTN